MYAFLRVLLIVILAAFPLFAGKELEGHNWKWAGPFLGLTGLLAVIEILFDRREAKDATAKLDNAKRELETLQKRLDHQKKFGLSMQRLIDVMLPATNNLDLFTAMVGELKTKGQAGEDEIRQLVEDGVETTNNSIRKILVGAEQEIRAYWSWNEDSVKCNLMVAHRVKDCSPEVVEDLKQKAHFLGYGRELGNYHTVLELTLWGTPDPQIPPIAIPVEDPTRPGSEDWLIPGAPQAFALKEDTVVSDTAKISELFPKELDHQTRQQIVDYFRGKRLRSFVCLVLQEGAQPIGVLTIQSDNVDICGPGGRDKGTIAMSMAHYRFCLQQLIAGQQKLRESAS
jgi:hypothetical protein